MYNKLFNLLTHYIRNKIEFQEIQFNNDKKQLYILQISTQLDICALNFHKRKKCALFYLEFRALHDSEKSCREM